jgi:polar amino acid transport system substrate-binding protein
MRFLTLIGLIGVLMAASACAETVAFQSTETPPYWSANLPENGLGGAFLKLFSDQAGISYTINYLPVKRYRQSQATYLVGDPDILLNQKHRAIFPIGIFHTSFFYYKPHHAEIEFHGLRSLRGYTLGVLRGTLEDKSSFIHSGIKVEESDSAESLLRKLKRGRIDLCILVEGAGRYTVGRLFPQEQEDFVGLVIPGLTRPLAVMIDVGDPEGKIVARHYRQVLDKTLHSRQYQDILEAFYGRENIPDGRDELLDKFVHDYANTWDR